MTEGKGGNTEVACHKYCTCWPKNITCTTSSEGKKITRENVFQVLASLGTEVLGKKHLAA